MDYKITPSSHGGFTVTAGCAHKGGESNPTNCPGVTLPAFIVYESCHCDTRREALATVERMKKHH
jgi:lipoprotein